MKRLSYVLFGSMLALGAVACGGNGGENGGSTDTPSSTDTPGKTDKPSGSSLELGQRCTPAMKDPCKTGLGCVELSDYAFAEDIAICLKKCTNDADCGAGSVCGDDYGFYEGYCVDEYAHYSLAFPGDIGGCPRNSVSTSMLFGLPTSVLFEEGKDNVYANMIGFCAPICEVADLGELVDGRTAVASCPTVNLKGGQNDLDYDFFGFDGMPSTCEKVFDDAEFKLCTIPSKVGGSCDGGVAKCAEVYDRKGVQYDENGHYVEGQDMNGVFYCSYDVIYSPDDNLDYDEENDLYTGTGEGALLSGECIQFCSNSAGCACAEGDAGCKVGENQFRDCYILRAEGQEDRGGRCLNFNKCSTAADCPKMTGYTAKCVDPAVDVYKIDEVDFHYGVGQKFCDYDVVR